MTVYVLESLEEKDSDTYAAACESLWGEGLPSVSIDNTKKYLVTPPTSREVSVHIAKSWLLRWVFRFYPFEARSVLAVNLVQ